jgi:hypothetical protein
VYHQRWAAALASQCRAHCGVRVTVYAPCRMLHARQGHQNGSGIGIWPLSHTSTTEVVPTHECRKTGLSSHGRTKKIAQKTSFNNHLVLRLQATNASRQLRSTAGHLRYSGESHVRSHLLKRPLPLPSCPRSHIPCTCSSQMLHLWPLTAAHVSLLAGEICYGGPLEARACFCGVADLGRKSRCNAPSMMARGRCSRTCGTSLSSSTFISLTYLFLLCRSCNHRSDGA